MKYYNYIRIQQSGSIFSFVLTEGPANETQTDEAVVRMTNWIYQNCFELKYDGMEIKFTTLQERNIHTDKQMNEWCKDGDLAFYYTGEFEKIRYISSTRYANKNG